MVYPDGTPVAGPAPEPKLPKIQPMASNMTLRDWFAGMAMQSFIRNLEQAVCPYAPEDIARDGYMVADAMLAERQRVQDGG